MAFNGKGLTFFWTGESKSKQNQTKRERIKIFKYHETKSNPSKLRGVQCILIFFFLLLLSKMLELEFCIDVQGNCKYEQSNFANYKN